MRILCVLNSQVEIHFLIKTPDMESLPIFFLHRTLLLNRVPGEFKVAFGHLEQPYTVYVQTLFKQKLTYLNTMVLHTKFLQQL